MTVQRIVANVAMARPAEARAFWGTFLGLETAMDLGWIVTFAAPPVETRPQVSVASEGGNGTPLPDISVEVDDLDAYRERAVAAGIAIEYGPVDEPWGVRRFFVRDPAGRLINIVAHRG